MSEQLNNEDQMLEAAVRYANEAGQIIVERMSRSFQIEEKKNQYDLVTEIDVLSEMVLRDRIAQDYPDHWILSEESDGGREDSHQMLRQPQEGYGWIIDPIDGTTNFIHGGSHFAISIGILKDGIPVCGIVYSPVTGDLYTGRKGSGAYWNGRRIQVGPQCNIGEALLATGFQATDWKPDSLVVKQIGSMTGIARGIRIFGAASLDLCLLASGRLTGFWHDGLYPWDVAAGVVIVQEAGGIVTNVEGKPFHISDDTLVASNLLIHDTLLSILK